ncbi:Coiled-coil domain-containing protein, partial [Intoshia linei]
MANPQEIVYPPLYKSYSSQEVLVNKLVDNFIHQYQHLYPDRRPLMLSPVNECGLQKFVCTTINPTIVPIDELYYWSGLAEFVSNYFKFEMLNLPYELPKTLRSPSTVLESQSGNCFEYSSLLCSFLIGAGYDAYVVNGYASLKICVSDESFIKLNNINETFKVRILLMTKRGNTDEIKKKYHIKPIKSLTSRFDKEYEEKVKRKLEEEEQRKQEQLLLEMSKDIEEDKLYGQRVHSWILVLENNREVAETFFIEPFTGRAYSTKNENFHGIESVWNHKNYWVNIQQCNEGTKQMSFNLNDSTTWEYMFMDDSPKIDLIDIEENFELDDDNMESSKYVKLPESWTQPIHLTIEEFKKKCPTGKKVVLYENCKVETFPEYINKDGMVERRTVYNDKNLSEIKSLIEKFDHRADGLYNKTHNIDTSYVTEYFQKGRMYCLKEHRYSYSLGSSEMIRLMRFDSSARIDGLNVMYDNTVTLDMHFEKRNDYLKRTFIKFNSNVNTFIYDTLDANKSCISEITEYYDRNEELNANDDVERIIFNLENETIYIRYHIESDKITYSYLEYKKIVNVNENTTSSAPKFTQDMVDYNMVEKSKTIKLFTHYNNLKKFMNHEDKSVKFVLNMKKEIYDIINSRTQEDIISELVVSCYNTHKNVKSRQRRDSL